MSKTLSEAESKARLAAHGVPLAPERLCSTADEAVAAADELGYPCVIKAQVLVGGRGKAGGIKVARDTAEARAHATAILGMDIRGFTVHEVWVGEAAAISEEYYASVVLDRSAKAPLMMFSTRGGVDIEQVAAAQPMPMSLAASRSVVTSASGFFCPDSSCCFERLTQITGIFFLRHGSTS